ncbi:TRAP transporter small permease subunit [Pseudooceanicola aestuarii]|uniref:TRAP transporter small permease subunit n=1 Tax=Pseudooceanicola aestuarii TaxID=2697319 RepID=UPI0013D1D1D4|nr:TRAP transporter small permease [Pseudooceanicola aestuarii]
MSSATTTAPPGLPGGGITRFTRHAALILAIFGGLGTLGIMAIINADVVGRGFFDAPVPATAEIVSAAIVAVVYLQLPQATAMGRNVRSDMLITRLTSRSPRAGAWLNAAHHLAGTIMLAILLRYIGPEIYGAIEDNETVGLYGLFTMPRWPFVTCVLLGCVLTLVVYAAMSVDYIRLAIRGDQP